MQPFFNAAPPRWSSQRGLGTSYHLWQGVRTRRILAFCLDLAFLGTLVLMLPFVFALLLGPLGLAAGILGFGLWWLVIPPMLPFIAFFYSGITVASRRMGTPGMRAMGLEIRQLNGGRMSFVHAGLHAILLYLSWTVPIVFLVSFFNEDKACLHDWIAQARVMRRS